MRVFASSISFAVLALARSAAAHDQQLELSGDRATALAVVHPDGKRDVLCHESCVETVDTSAVRVQLLVDDKPVDLKLPATYRVRIASEDRSGLKTGLAVMGGVAVAGGSLLVVGGFLTAIGEGLGDAGCPQYGKDAGTCSKSSTSGGAVIITLGFLVLAGGVTALIGSSMLESRSIDVHGIAF